METNKLLKYMLDEEQMTFKGWDFSYINKRIQEEPLPWDYRTILDQYIRPTDKLLDMGTGGGEFLLTLKHPYNQTTVTESYEPNIQLCQQNLSPLGITVVPVNDDEKLPIQDLSFDIVINRHESYDINEVKRILKPNGYFITQQVGGTNNNLLSKVYDPNFTYLHPKLNLTNEKENFIKAGFDIVYGNEFFPYLRFLDIGAVVYFSKIIPWEFPNFAVNKNYEQLVKINEEILSNKYFESIEHRFIIVAKKK